AFVLFQGQGALREWGYVTLSRARRETRLYLSGRARERETQGREPDRSQPAARLARALGRPAAERLAVAHAPEGRRERQRALEGAEQQVEAAGGRLRDHGSLGRRRRAALDRARKEVDVPPAEKATPQQSPSLPARIVTRAARHRMR